jgi:AraC-like DNA-binding protein
MTTASIGYRRGQPSAAGRFSASRGPGLFREELLGTVPARTMSNLFHDLRRVSRGQFIGEYPDRHSQGARLPVERSQGHGRWELYRVDHGLYVVAADCVYDTPRDEVVAGEGLIEFSLRLSGRLQLNLPGRARPVDVEGPALLMLHLPAGMPITERIEANRRDAVVSLYSSPQYLRTLVERSGDCRLPVSEAFDAHAAGNCWYQLSPLSPSLCYVAQSLLDSPYHHVTRLLHAEAKALELLCELLRADDREGADMEGADAGATAPAASARSDSTLRRLNLARRLLGSQFNPPPRIGDVARAASMSESTLKRAFTDRFGISVSDYGKERRMQHALQLLRCSRLPIGEVSIAVGYRHQTSFTSAFRDFFGFLPRDARTDGTT